MKPSPHHRSFAMIGWNGLTIEIPPTWECRVAGKTHLLFEQDFQAIMEVRWQKVKKDNPAAHFASLRRQFTKLSGDEVNTRTPPTEITEMFGKTIVEWTRPNEVDRTSLVFLYLPGSRISLIAQLYHEVDHEKWKSLASIEIHPVEESDFTYRIQDIRARIPAGFIMEQWTMQAGFTLLSFSRNTTSLKLCRLAPADLRLQENSLDELFAALLGIPRDKWGEETFTPESSGVLHYHLSPGILGQMSQRLRRQKPFVRARFWHLHEANRLLGVFVEDVRPLSARWYHDICEAYEIAPIQGDKATTGE